MLIQQYNPAQLLSSEAGDISLADAQYLVASGQAAQVNQIKFLHSYGAAGPNIREPYAYSAGDVALVGTVAGCLDEVTAKTLLQITIAPFNTPIAVVYAN